MLDAIIKHGDKMVFCEANLVSPDVPNVLYAIPRDTGKVLSEGYKISLHIDADDIGDLFYEHIDA
jgi:hypothetical protein